jgi:hypothetical protein
LTALRLISKDKTDARFWVFLRRLALDIFTILEDCHLDARITTVYPGIRSVLRRAQATALASRPRIECLPVQETLVELLLRMSLEAFTDLPVPRDYEEVALLLTRLPLHANAAARSRRRWPA